MYFMCGAKHHSLSNAQPSYWNSYVLEPTGKEFSQASETLLNEVNTTTFKRKNLKKEKEGEEYLK